MTSQAQKGVETLERTLVAKKPGGREELRAGKLYTANGEEEHKMYIKRKSIKSEK